MPTLTPVDHDPFAQGAQPKLTPVDHDPFAAQTTGLKPPSTMDRVQQWASAPTSEANSMADFAARVVPSSVGKAVVGLPMAAAGIGKSLAQGVQKDAEEGSSGGIGNALYHGILHPNTVKAAWGAAKGVAGAMGEKAGFLPPSQLAEGDAPINYGEGRPSSLGQWAQRVEHQAITDPVGLGLVMEGGLKGVKSAGKMVGQSGLEGSAELAGLSKLHGVPLTVGEETGNAGLKNMETQLERVPIVGTRGFREVQSNKLASAANNIVDRFAPGGNTVDIPDQIQTSMLKTLKAGKDSINTIQGEISKAAKSAAPIAPQNLRAATVNLLDQFPDIFDRLPSTTLKSKLDAIAEGTADKTENIRVDPQDGLVKGGHGPQTQPKMLLDDQGNPIKRTVEASIDFKDAMRLREMLNDYLSRAYKSGGAVGNKELYQLSELKRGLDADINKWGENSSNGEIVDLFKKRNAEYIKKVVPFKDAVVKTATGSAFDTDLMYKKFIQPDRPQLARKLMQSLDEEGQGLVRYSILKKAMEAGQDTKPGVPFSPAKFAREIERLGPTIDAVFPGTDKQLIQGFAKLARVAERAGQFAENPPTGLRAGDMGISVGLGAGAVTHPLAMAGGLGAAKALSSMLTSDLGKRILIKAARTPETSSMWSKILGSARQFTNFRDDQIDRLPVGHKTEEGRIDPHPGYAEGGMVDDSLRPSIQFQGRQIDGTPDQHHDDILAANKIGARQKHERGFVGPDGAFMTRDEGMEWLKENKPDVHAKLQEDGVKELHTQDLMKARREMNDSKQGEAEKKAQAKKPNRRKARKEMMDEE